MSVKATFEVGSGIVKEGFAAPRNLGVFHIYADETVEDETKIEKIALVNCIPSDQAADLYVYDYNENMRRMIEQKQIPYSMVVDEALRKIRVMYRETEVYDLEMASGAIVKIILEHQPDFFANSTS